MTSYQNTHFSDVTNVNFCNNVWEEFFAANHNQYENTQTEILKLQDVEPGVPDLNYSDQILTSSCSESSTLLSPTWEDSVAPVQNPVYTSMSSYFSSFNPSDQTQENSVHHFSSTPTLNNFNGYQARFSFAPSTNGSHTSVARKKRKRTVFTTEQVDALEEVFAKRPYVTRDERQVLVEKLNVNDKSVKIWFQNRRLKNKREEQLDAIEDTSNTDIFERINTLESKLFERVDAFGFVKLDDKIMTELVNVIDDYFTIKANLKAKTEVEVPIYEPISPASSEESDFHNIGTKWEGYTNLDTQDLVDLESIILSKC